jgi:chromosome segregation ATPase
MFPFNSTVKRFPAKHSAAAAAANIANNDNNNMSTNNNTSTTPALTRHKRSRTNSIAENSLNPLNLNSTANSAHADCQLRWQSINARNELLELQIFTLKQEREIVQQELASLTNKFNNGQSTINSLTRTNSAVQEEVRKLEEQLRAIEAQLKLKEEENSVVLLEKNQIIQEMKDKLSESKLNEIQYENANNLLHNELKQVELLSRQRDQKLLAEKLALEDRLNCLESELAIKSAQNNELNIALDNLNNETKCNQSCFQQQINELTQELSGIEDRSKLQISQVKLHHEEQLSQERQEKQRIKENFENELRNFILLANQTKERNVIDRQSLEEELQGREESINSLNNQVEELKEETAGKEEIIIHLNQELNQLKLQLSQADTNIRSLNYTIKQLESSQQKSKEADQQESSNTRDRGMLLSEINYKKQENLQLTGKVQAVEALAHKLTADNTELSNQLKQLRHRLKQARAQFQSERAELKQSFDTVIQQQKVSREQFSASLTDLKSQLAAANNKIQTLEAEVTIANSRMNSTKQAKAVVAVKSCSSKGADEAAQEGEGSVSENYENTNDLNIPSSARLLSVRDYFSLPDLAQQKKRLNPNANPSNSKLAKYR